MAPPELIIFDCDGVLVDSEPISIAVLGAVIAEAGVSLSRDAVTERFLGISLASTCGILERDFGLVFTPEHLDRMRTTLYDRLRRDLKPIAGIRDVLAGVPTARCVASSSQPERIRLSLSVTGLLEGFEPHVFSATMVSNGKPAPDLFLHAARAMNVAPRDCVVIEDSPAGIAAAKRAGMRVFAFTGGSHAAGPAYRAALEALGPEEIFDTMALLPDLLRRC